MDLRSGFWQVGLNHRAQELTEITTSIGRCFSWLCMPFGLQGAPGAFHEMIELLVGKVKNKETLKGISPFHIGAFFDDCGVSTDTPQDHIKVLKELFEECKGHQIRIKVSKCEFTQEDMDYLGFQVGNRTWSSSPQKGGSNSED